MMPPALAVPSQTITLAGVQLNNFRGHGAATTFLSRDPADNAIPAYQLQPGPRAQFSSVGVNLPSHASGNLPNIGTYVGSEFLFEVPNLGPPPDAGLSYFVQTSDGFLHTATSTSVLEGSPNGFNFYSVLVLPNQFSPALNSQAVNTFNIRYSSHFGGGTIFYLVAPGETGILGSQGVIGTFNENTLNDGAFNN